MTRDEILQKLRTLLAEQFEVPPEAIKPSARLVEDLGLDSLDAIEIAVNIQELTKVRVPEAELRKLRTVSDALDVVERLLAGGSATGEPGPVRDEPAG